MGLGQGTDADGIGWRDGRERVLEDYERAQADQCQRVLDSYRSGGQGWDEALINGLGKREILEQLCGVENTDANWEAVGLEWCQRYNQGCKDGAAQAVAELEGADE